MVRTTERGSGRDRILQGGLTVLADRGYGGASMQRIADAAGVDKALLHYHFADRSGLFAALTEHVGDRLFGPVLATIPAAAPPADLADAGFAALWDLVVAEPELYAAYLNLTTSAVSEPDLREHAARVRERYRGLVGAGLAAARAAGWELDGDEAAFVTLIVAGLDGLAIDFLDRGMTPELAAAREGFEAWMVGRLVKDRA